MYLDIGRQALGRRFGDAEKIVCQNRKARHDYFIDDIYEAGIVLQGPEVKSLREGRVSLTDTYAKVKNEELFFVQYAHRTVSFCT